MPLLHKDYFNIPGTDSNKQVPGLFKTTMCLIHKINFQTIFSLILVLVLKWTKVLKLHEDVQQYVKEEKRNCVILNNMSTFKTISVIY